MPRPKLASLCCFGISSILLLSCRSSELGFSGTAVPTTETTKTYYFVMEDSKQREILQKVSELRLGDSRDRVVRNLGKPTYDRADVTKDGKGLGRSVTYYLKIWEKGLANEKHDRFVTLRFDTSDRLTEIVKKVEN